MYVNPIITTTCIDFSNMCRVHHMLIAIISTNSITGTCMYIWCLFKYLWSTSHVIKVQIQYNYMYIC